MYENLMEAAVTDENCQLALKAVNATEVRRASIG